MSSGKDAVDPVIEAEQIVLGAAMLNSATMPKLASTIGAADFQRAAHTLVWQAITALHTEDAPTDAMAVANRMLNTGELTKVGGAPYLHDLIAVVPSTANGGYYAEVVAEAAKRRRIEEVGIRLSQAATSPGTDLTKVAESVQDALSQSQEGWPDPIPLTGDERGLPAFPVDVLPDWWGDMVAATATATGTPPDLAGSLSLACMATAVMGRVQIEPKPGWTEPANLFTCTALGPGNRKSAVFDALVEPLQAAEAELTEETAPRRTEAEVEKAIAVKNAEQALAAAGKGEGDPDAINNAKTAAREAEELEVPAIPQLITNDATPEVIKSRLAQQHGRLAILDDEGGIFQTIAGRYSGTPDPDVILKGHAGGRIRVDRKNGPTEDIPRATLTIGLAVQPDVIRDLSRIPGFESRGFLARFLWSMPQSLVGHRPAAPPATPSTVKAAYDRRLRELAITMWHTSDTKLELTVEAQQRIQALEDEREPKLRKNGEWEPILTWANKWTGAVARIAALLHIAENLATGWRCPVEADTIDAAAIIGYYYACHALATWAYMGTDQRAGTATQVLEWLQTQADSSLTKRDIHRGLRRKLSLPQLDTALHTLADYGHIRIHQPDATNRGRRPSPRIHIHPIHVGGAQ